MSNEELLNMRKIVKLAFIRIGIRCDMSGFRYLCKAVEFVILDESLLHSLCKRLYPMIASEFNLDNVGTVERCMRHAIENTAEIKSFVEINKMYNCLIFTIDDKPTVGELIHLVAQYYLLGLYKENN